MALSRNERLGVRNAPAITTAILDGHQPARLTTTTLIKQADLPTSWSERRRTFGFM